MNLSPLPIQKFFDNAGRPLNGGLLFTYVATTTTKIATYTDSTGGTPNTNPIVLNYRGEANVWLDPTLTYKFVLAPSTDTDPPTNPIWSVDNITAAISYATLISLITQQFIGLIFYPRSNAEIAAGVVPVNFFKIYGDVLRYGTNTTPGTTDLTSAITNALLAAIATGGTGTVYHPGGVILHASTITVPNGVTIYGNDRNACEFTYSGVGDGWQNINGPNSSGYGKVRFQGLKLTSTNAANVGAAIELNSGGFAYYQIVDCWLFNKWKYGVILDGTELCVIERNILDLANATTAGIWIVNGADRTVGQLAGFTNTITIINNQISLTGGTGIIDDGGNNHVITGNNFNEHSLALRIAGVNSLVLIGNSLESHKATATATAQFTNLTSGGINVGQNTNCVIKGNGFYTDQASGNNLIFISQTYTITAITQAAKAVITLSTVSATHPLTIPRQFGLPVTFAGVVGMTQINGVAGFIDTGTALGGVSGAWTATILIDSTAFTAYASGGNISHFHAGMQITENIFGWTVGRAAAIDVQQMTSSFCGYNFDLAQSTGMAHYANVHNDRSGNTLLPPQNGSLVNLGGINGPTYGDTRYPNIFGGGQQIGLLGSTIATKLKGTATFTAATTNAVAFGVTLSSAVYQITLAQSATSPLPPWWTTKATTGFTINFSANFTGTVDWIVEQ